MDSMSFKYLFSFRTEQTVQLCKYLRMEVTITYKLVIKIEMLFVNYTSYLSELYVIIQINNFKYGRNVIVIDDILEYQTRLK